MNGSLNLHPKVAGSGLFGALSLLSVWILSLFHVSVDPEVAASLTTVLMILGGYLAPVLQKELGAAAPVAVPVPVSEPTITPLK